MTTENRDSVKLSVADLGPKSLVGGRIPATYPVNDRIRGARVGKTPGPVPEVRESRYQAQRQDSSRACRSGPLSSTAPARLVQFVSKHLHPCAQDRTAAGALWR
jgi:hypothetical protein